MTDAPKAMSLANLRELPSLPQVIIDLQSAISREDVSIDAIAETVSRTARSTAFPAGWFPSGRR